MATSPKYRPASIARYSSGGQPSTSSRRYTHRRLIIILAFALLVSSGTMLVFHAVTGSFSLSSSSRSTGPGCRKDAEFSIIRWGTNKDSRNSNNNGNGNFRQDPERHNNDNNNGAGSPWINDNDHPSIEHERPRQAIPKLDDEHDIQPPQDEQQQQPIVNSPREPLVQENSNNNSADETTPDEEGVAGDEDESSEEVEEYPPFEDSLDASDSTQYITYLPYAGITNQFYGMLRGMEIAKALGRTLIIPPITASSHDKSKQNQPWSKFLDLDRFQELTGAKVVEFHKLRDVEQAEFNQLQCRITCGFGSKRTIDFTAKGFLKQWKLNVTLSALSVDATKIDTITKVLAPHRRDKYICISNTYKISVPDKSEWERFGQHLHFTQELEDFVQAYLDKNLEKPEAVYDPKTRTTIVPTQKYIAIHARRGDFAQYCQDNFKGPKMIHCLPSTEDFAARIDVIQARLNPTGSLKGILPVFVATNERRPEELKKFADLGWSYLDHDLMGTADQLGVFGPMMVDQVFMAHAQALVGIQMSTFSRVGALRQRDWHNRKMEYL
ncbi:MAG: GDP-fucose protein O-fucosyltransferase-domain-containing protein [Linnemannia elongata]|nr:MAG: GDP-fucose protein O-fucosyltransferase-domain-containing protein [Linnemannia elongata]